MKVVVCICTYRRPNGLQRLLASLQTLPASAAPELVVVDNDSRHEGIAVAASMRQRLPFAVHAEAAAESGISSARNRAVTRALALRPDFIAFLDDDEWPSDQWFDELLVVQQRTGADVVGGPTLPCFPGGTDPRIQDNPYFGADLDLPDGAACRLQAAGNFLIRARTIAALAPNFFHPAFGRSGGEDLAFFTQLHQRGARMHWARHAIVHEQVPPTRLSDDWMRNRVVTIANSRVRVAQLLEPTWDARLLRGLKTTALGMSALLVSLAGTLHPVTRRRGTMLRWKFEGKLRAHLGNTSVRRDETP